MSNIFNVLASLANELDKQDLTKLADVVDGIHHNTVQIKTAQYVGLQGYWMRNRRCWENCYRIKRANNPEMPANDVWWECQGEYEKSINNDDSAWNKYAGEDADLLKTASAEDKKVYAQEEQFFSSNLKSKVDNGWNVGAAVFDTIDHGLSEDRYKESFADNASKLADVALELKKLGHEELSKYAGKISSEFVKMSQFNQGQWWNPLNWKQRGKEWLAQQTGKADPALMSQRLQRVLNEVENARTRFPQDMSTVPQQQQQQVQQAFNQLVQKIQPEIQALSNMSRNDPASGQMYQQVMTAFDNFARNPQPASRRQALDQLAQTISGAINTTPTLQETQPGNQARPDLAGEEDLHPESMSPAQQQQSMEEFQASQGQQPVAQPEGQQPAAQQFGDLAMPEAGEGQAPAQTPAAPQSNWNLQNIEQLLNNPDFNPFQKVKMMQQELQKHQQSQQPATADSKKVTKTANRVTFDRSERLMFNNLISSRKKGF